MSTDSLWLAVGFLGQAFFSSRFLVQWIASERQRKSIIPHAFWFLSLGGGLLLLSYAIHRGDPVFILGQSTGALIYCRNLRLISRSKKEQLLSLETSGSDLQDSDLQDSDLQDSALQNDVVHDSPA